MPEKEERQIDLPRSRNGVPQKDVGVEDGVEDIVCAGQEPHRFLTKHNATGLN